MMYVDFNAGNKDYKLRLNTRDIIALEKKLGCNPIAIFGNGDTIPTVTTMITILHMSLQNMHHGIDINETYNIFDAYLEDGHVSTDFIPIIVDIYKMSGIIRDVGEKEKN